MTLILQIAVGVALGTLTVEIVSVLAAKKLLDRTLDALDRPPAPSPETKVTHVRILKPKPRKEEWDA